MDVKELESAQAERRPVATPKGVGYVNGIGTDETYVYLPLICRISAFPNADIQPAEPAQALRGCILTRELQAGQVVPTFVLRKLMGDTLTPADPGVPIPAIADWLRNHGYREHGAMIGEERSLAVVWLLAGDEPEYLSAALGQRIVPASVRYDPEQNKFVSTNTKAAIRSARQRRPTAQDDFAFVELPTRAARARAYGL